MSNNPNTFWFGVETIDSFGIGCNKCKYYHKGSRTCCDYQKYLCANGNSSNNPEAKHKLKCPIKDQNCNNCERR